MNMVLTENQSKWLRELLMDEAEDAEGNAINNDLWASASDGDESGMFIQNADELREYAKILRYLAEELELNEG